MTLIVGHPDDLLSMVGIKLEPTDWIVVDQARINLFADATGDHQWIHVDPDKAKDGPFGACIAHGYLTLSLVNCFLPELLQVKRVSMGVNYGCDKVRFPNVVKVGQKIRARGEIVSVEERSGGMQVVVRVEMEIEGEERPACVVDTISRFYADQKPQEQDTQ